MFVIDFISIRILLHHNIVARDFCSILLHHNIVVHDFCSNVFTTILYLFIFHVISTISILVGANVSCISPDKNIVQIAILL